MKKHGKITFLIIICYFGLYAVVGLSLLTAQPFGNPPDEYNRYLIPQYIAEHGTLPDGFDESVRIGGYGFSYAFQPVLPYMLQGYAMRFVKLFAASDEAMLYAARGVNFILGLINAGIVLLLSRKWFSDNRFGFVFAFAATFLPQSIFVHTYVNTDSCCMLSIAVMLYGLTLGLKDGFSGRASVTMAVGIILCALSYYNAYGYILSCILLFTASFFSVREGKLRPDGKAFLKKGCFISAVVLLGIAWWFIRSALLYDGDFLGLRTRDECARLYALPEFHPDTRMTWQNRGLSLWTMLKESDFLTLSVLSFIGIYGPMTIITSIWVYRFYRTLFFLGALMCALIPVSASPGVKALYPGRKGLRIFSHCNMIFCIIMPFILSLIYSYSTDYQPQGRYLLPALLPLCLYAVRGTEKLCRLKLLQRVFSRFPKIRRERVLTCFTALLCATMAGLLLLTVYGYAFPYYAANPVAP